MTRIIVCGQPRRHRKASAWRGKGKRAAPRDQAESADEHRILIDSFVIVRTK